MDNLFAYLGEWGSIDTLTLKNSTISELLHIILPEFSSLTAGESLDQIIARAKTPVELADAIISYFQGSILEYPMVNSSGEITYHNLQTMMQPIINIDPNKYILELFNTDLNQIKMVLRDELKYVMILSYVYTQTLDSSRVGKENPITAAYHFKNRRSFSSKAQNYTGSNPKIDHSLLQSMIYRKYDDINQPHIIQSALDFGIVWGLVTSTTAKYNPYIGRKEEKKEEKDRHLSFSDIQKFINGFQYAFISEDTAKTIANNQLLHHKVSPQYIMLFNQWAVERFSNINYLISVFDFTNTINPTYGNLFESLFKQLMILPLPKSRLTIVQCLKHFILQNEKENRLNNNYLPFVQIKLNDFFIKLVEIVLPVLILTFHYAMYQYTEKDGNVAFGFTEYFKHLQELRCYEYVTKRNNQMDTTQPPYQLQDMDLKSCKFVEFAKPYYLAFIDKTNEYTEKYNFKNRFDGKLKEVNVLYFQIFSDIMLGILKTEDEYIREYMPNKTLGRIKT